MAIFTKKKRDTTVGSGGGSVGHGGPSGSPPLGQAAGGSQFNSASGRGGPPGSMIGRYQDGSINGPTGVGSNLPQSNSGNFTPPASSIPVLASNNGPSSSNTQQQLQQQPPSSSSGPPSQANSSSNHTVLYPWAQRRLHYLPSALLPPSDPSNPTAPITPIRGPTSAPPFPRYGHSVNPVATIPNGDLYIFGGLVQNAVKNDLYVLGCAPGGSSSGGTGSNGPQGALSVGLVETRGEVPGPRVGHASVGVGNVLIVWGGDTKSRPEDRQDDSLYLLNLSTREWTRVKTHGPTPEGRYGHAAAMVGSRFFIFGGQKDDGGFMNDLVWFDLQKLKAGSPKWTFVEYTPTTVAPPKRTGHTTVTFGDCIYVFGGTDGQYHYNDTWSYDVNTQVWTELSCIGYIPVPREGHAATLVDDVMYIFGGRGVDGKDLEDLAAFKITNQRWFMFQNMGPAPSGRSGHAMATWQNKVYVLGGESYTSARADDPSFVHVLDTSKIKYPSDSRSGGGSRKSSIPVMSPNPNSAAEKAIAPPPPSSQQPAPTNGLPQVQVIPPNIAPTVPESAVEEEGRRAASPTGRNVPSHENGVPPSFGQAIEQDQQQPGVKQPVSIAPRSANQQAQQTSKVQKRLSIGSSGQQLAGQPPVRPARPGDEPGQADAAYRRTQDPERAMSPTGQQQQRNRAMSPQTTSSPTSPNGPRPRGNGSPPQQSAAQFGINAVRTARSPSPNQHLGSSEGGDHVDASSPASPPVNAAYNGSPPPQDAFYYPNNRSQTNGRAPSPSPASSDALKSKDDEIAALKSREAWMKTALAVATRKGFAPGDSVDEEDVKSLEALHPTLEDGTNKQIIQALLQMKQELAKAQLAMAEQAQTTDERIAAAGRAKAAALQEASYYRAKLAALESGSAGDASKLERERTSELEKKLSESLSAKAMLERQVEKLEGDVEHHTQMRASVEERHQAATSRADLAENSYSRALTDYADLQRRSHGHESTIQEQVEQIATLTSSAEQLKADNELLRQQHEASESSVTQYLSTIEETQLALTAANTRNDELHGLWQQAQSDVVEHKARAVQLQTDLDAKHLEVTTASSKAADLERVLKATREEHEATRVLATGSLAELVASHREGKSRELNASTDSNPGRLKALEDESAALKRMHQDVRTKSDSTVRELDEVRAREVSLQTQVLQLRAELSALRKQHAQALDDVNRHKTLAADRDAEAKESARVREASDVRVGLLRQVMSDHGIVVSDDDLATRFPPMTGNETPEQLHRRVQELEARLEQKTRAHQELESSHDDAQRELARHRDLANEQVDQLNTELARLRSTAASPEDGARAVKAEEDLEVLQGRHRQLESTHLKAVQYVKGTEKMLRRMKEELTRYKERNEELEAEVGANGGAAELEAARSQIRELTDSSNKSALENKELQRRLTSIQNDYERKLSIQQAELSAKVHNLENELNKLDQDLDKAQQELEETHVVNNSLNKELQAALKGGNSQPGLAEELAAAQKKTDWLKKENAQLEKRCEIAEQKISILLDHMEAGDRGSVDGSNYSPAEHELGQFESEWRAEGHSEGSPVEHRTGH